MTRRVPLRPFLALLLLLVLGLAGLGAPAAVAAGGPGHPPLAETTGAGEKMAGLRVRATVKPDGSMDVVETVTWDFGGRTGHGIRRAVTTAQDVETNGKYRQYVLKDPQVSSPSGASADLDVSASGPFTVLRIGSPETTVSGRQTYEIRYTLLHVVNKTGEGVELYWNFPGFEVGVPVTDVDIEVTGPGDIGRTGCTAGPRGSTATCPATANGRTATFRPPDLAPHSTATIALSMPASAFTDTTADIRDGSAIDHGYVPSFADEWPVPMARAVSIAGYAGGPLLALLGIGLMGATVWRRGRDEQYVDAIPGLTPARLGDTRTRRGATKAAAVQFQPPQDIEPGLLGTVLDEQANTIDVSATVVDLAARGFLTIAETEGEGVHRDDWVLTRAGADESALRPYERTLMNGIFATGPTVRLSELRRKFSGTLAMAQQEMYDEVVARGWFASSPVAQRRSWLVLGLVLLAAGAGLAFLLTSPGQQIDTRSGISALLPSLLVLGLGLAIAGAVVAWMSRHMSWRTARGSAVQAQSLGFRQYLATAEAGQIRFEEASGLFSRYLPYAIVYGVADRWAATFQQVAEAAEAAGTPLAMPGWYLFYGPGFGFDGFSRRLDDFATTSTGTFAASAAATTGSSGGSAFDGGGFGGFSGGGGGGGGFSSW